jgi:hypothetical protein
MKGPTAKWSFGRLRRSVLVLGAAGVAAGALVAGAATAARADTPTQVQGALVLTPATGSTATNGIPFSTTIACPTGFQGSGELFSIDGSGNPIDALSQTLTAVSTPPSGNLIAPFTQIAADEGTNNFELAIFCYANGDTTATGSTYEIVQTTTITISGTTYSSGAAAAKATTSVSLATVPAGVTSVNSGASVDVEATISASDGTHPAGSVQFSVNGSTTGISPISVAAGATTADYSTSFTATTPTSESYTAVFTPTTTASYNTSPTSNTVTVTVQPTGTLTAANSPIAISVTVLTEGTFAVTVEPPASVTLTRSAAYTYTGTMPTIQVDDNRNSYPGWSVSGQESPFTGTAGTISASQLGWTPAAVTPVVAGVTVDGATAPGTTPGLANVTELAHAVSGGGFGLAQQFNAMLTLDIPTTAHTGAYAGQLSITAIPSHA